MICWILALNWDPMSFQDPTPNRFGGATVASYHGPSTGNPTVTFGNFQLRFNSTSLDVELRALSGAETVLCHNLTQWEAGTLSVDGRTLLRLTNVPLTQTFVAIGDPGIVIAHGEWRTYDISPVASADGRWYRIHMVVSTGNSLTRISVQVMGNTANTPLRQSKTSPFATAVTSTEIRSGSLEFRYNANAASNRVAVRSAVGRSDIRTSSEANGIPAQLLNLPAATWTTVPASIPAANSDRRITFELFGPTELWEVIVVNHADQQVILTVESIV